MSMKQWVNGFQHIGVPTDCMQETVAFYQSLGFDIQYETMNGKNRVVFLKLGTAVVEAYESDEVTKRLGAIDHISLDVNDVDAAYREVTALGYKPLEPGMQELPFFEKGVRFFIITGPNHEKVEFNQIL